MQCASPCTISLGKPELYGLMQNIKYKVSISFNLRYFHERPHHITERQDMKSRRLPGNQTSTWPLWDVVFHENTSYLDFM